MINSILRAALVAGMFGAAFAAQPAAAASVNPMDHAGVGHNQYLDCLMQVGAPADDALRVVVEKCGFDAGMDTEAFVALYKPVVELDPNLTLSKKMSVFRDKFTSEEFSYFERIDQVVQGADTPETADKLYAALEQEAIAKLDPRSAGAANVLGTLSVVRHSTAYWAAFARKHDAVESGTTAKKLRWWKWLIIGAVDAAGYALTENIGTAASASNYAYDYFNNP